MGIIKQSTRMPVQITGKQPPISLYALAQEECPILVDTCVMDSASSHTSNFRGKRESWDMKIEFLDFFMDQLRQRGNFYFTSRVIREFTIPPDYSSFTNTSHFQNFKKLCDNCHTKRIECAIEIENLNRILRFGRAEQEYLDYLSKENWKLKRNWSLSDVDYDFLLSGIVLLSGEPIKEGEEKKVIGLTNDTNMHLAWESLMARLGISEEKFRLYRRTTFEAFEAHEFSSHFSKAPYREECRN